MSFMSLVVLVNFVKVYLHYFLVFLLLTLNILCLLRMSINSNLWYIFVEHEVRVIVMEVLAKH